MKLNIDFIENEILVGSDFVAVMEIENKDLFYRLVDLLNKYSKNEIESEIFERSVNLKLFFDYFNFDFGNKKTINGLIKLINSNVDELNRQNLVKYYNKLIKIYDSILEDLDVPLSLNQEIELDSILKTLNLKIVNQNSVLKNLLALIDVVKYTHECDLLIFVNLKFYLDKEELIEFYKYALYNGVMILLIDAQAYGITLKNEKKLIIDANLEEFMV